MFVGQQYKVLEYTSKYIKSCIIVIHKILKQCTVCSSGFVQSLIRIFYAIKKNTKNWVWIWISIDFLYVLVAWYEKERLNLSLLYLGVHS